MHPWAGLVWEARTGSLLPGWLAPCSRPVRTLFPPAVCPRFLPYWAIPVTVKRTPTVSQWVKQHPPTPPKKCPFQVLPPASAAALESLSP